MSGFDLKRRTLYVAGVAERQVKSRGMARAPKEPVHIGARESRQSIQTRARLIYPQGLGYRYDIYVRQTQALIAPIAPRSVFSVYAEDSRVRFCDPVFVKSRLIADRDAKGVLLPLNVSRHWSHLANLARHDRPFADKDDKLVWRGATTGRFVRDTDNDSYSARYHLAKLHRLSSGIDAKYSQIVQLDGCEDAALMALLKDRLGAPLSIRDQMASKFILCLEGNDVASGLKWMMASNSTVVMPPPTCETWFCEGELEPWVHYVPVAADLGDLNDIYDWCRSNTAACAEIAKAGRDYVARFLKPETEMQIIADVVTTYLANTDLRLRFGAAERARQIGNHMTLLYDNARFRQGLARRKNAIA